MKSKILEEQYLEILKEEYDIQIPTSFSEDEYWKRIKGFDFIYAMVRHGFIMEIINGEGKFGLFNRFPPSAHANEQRNTDYETIIIVLYILMKNGVIRDYYNKSSAYFKDTDNTNAKKYITNILINLELKKLTYFLYIYVCEFKWANTEKDILIDWRKIIEYINDNLINEEFLRNNKTLVSNFNSLNLGIKIKTQ